MVLSPEFSTGFLVTLLRAGEPSICALMKINRHFSDLIAQRGYSEHVDREHLMTPTVLVVEDNNINREVAILQLRALGFSAESVSDGNQALEAIKAKHFALILMDVMMPSMDGWEASRRIRDYEESIGRHTPIVAVSAWSANDSRERCISSGMDDYLEKPYDKAALKRILDTWCKQGREDATC